MPFGFNLPGPFTWHRQDKSGKKLLHQQQQQEAVDMLQRAAERSFHKDLIKYLGEAKGTEAIFELNRLKGVSDVLYSRLEKDLRARVKRVRTDDRAARAEARAKAKEAKKAN
ncbi:MULTISPECIES: hypothetical protein [Prauserella salsuginis group]|uniref:Uncharacterized protein n=1 Tax=Prauserella salsuginis TaxID=387889 RepID=A0ABW6GAV0_9PSEU|nr:MULTISPECIES: hypothetical protein [Prauserella salsuginis group]MCR3722409.1 hypothetical protein [Prauserella flava]MCR3736851.1 hypothetical protein [Prauserella salsuginis]